MIAPYLSYRSCFISTCARVYVKTARSECILLIVRQVVHSIAVCLASDYVYLGEFRDCMRSIAAMCALRRQKSYSMTLSVVVLAGRASKNRKIGDLSSRTASNAESKAPSTSREVANDALNRCSSTVKVLDYE